jgi:hypothetical protein
MIAKNSASGFWYNLNATETIVRTVGILCGLSGLEHGFFEMLQGNVKPAALMIDAIGPANRFWPGGTEPALTVIPSFLVTGILAMLASLTVILWSSLFIRRKGGMVGLLLLSILQFLVGGGFVQIFLVVMIAAAGTQIYASLAWYHAILPGGIRRFLAKAWLWFFIAFVLMFFGSISAAIFGYFPVISNLFNISTGSLVNFLFQISYFMLGLLVLTILAGFARDLERNRPTHAQK